MEAVAKKILAALLGDKRGRKFLCYVIGIALIIVLLPVIAVYGLFGWMAGGTQSVIDYNSVYEYLPPEFQSRIEAYDTELDTIEKVFYDNALTDSDISIAKTIYISCLAGKEIEEDFYQRYADCFLNRSEETGILQNITDTFGVRFSDADKQNLKQLYGEKIT